MIITYISSRAAARLLRVEVGTMRRWFANGKIEGCRNEDGAIWIDLREVQRILQPEGKP